MNSHKPWFRSLTILGSAPQIGLGAAVAAQVGGTAGILLGSSQALLAITSIWGRVRARSIISVGAKHD